MYVCYFWFFVGWLVLYWVLNGFGYYVFVVGFVGLDVLLFGVYVMMCCVVVGMMLFNFLVNVGVFWYFLFKLLMFYGVMVGDLVVIVFGFIVWLV